MKILYCIPTLEYGGAEQQLCYLVADLTRLGHEVHVAYGRGGPHYGRLVSGGAIMHDVRARGSHDPRLLVNLARLMSKLKPDVVQTFLRQMDITGSAAALLTRTPLVLAERSAAPGHPPGLKSTLRRMLGKRAGAIVSNSQAGDAYWQAENARRYIVANGIPLTEIDAVEAGIANRQTVLFAGRMDEGKNARTLIEALSRITNEVHFVAVLCGDGPQRAELERMAADRGLTQRVLFPGYVADLWLRMKSAGVLVSLSRYEGSPNVIAEAMACCCPLVVSDIPAHRELLGVDRALFVPADDAAAAAAAIRNALSLRAAAEARAYAARARIAQFTIESMVRRYEAIYESIRGRIIDRPSCTTS